VKNKFMKKILTLTASAALLGLAVLPALATSSAGNNCTNGTTGPFSTNNCTINNTSSVTVRNYNDAVIINDVESKSNTGGNKADYNTLGGTIYTGNSTNNTTVSSVANIVTTNITGGPAMSGNSGSNNVTGPMSVNNIGVRNNLDMLVDNQNTATVLNKVEADSNTGDNSASTNTGPGFIRTGNAVLGLQVGTHVNDILQDINAGAGGSGGNMAWNGTTGPFSTNNVTLNNSVDMRVLNFQDMVVKNNVEAESNSGENEAKKNTLGGDILTGDSFAGVGVNTEGNIVTTYLAAPMGGFGNAGGNSVTGPGGEYNGTDPGTNDVYVNNNQNILVDNQNNKCQSHNADTTAEVLHDYYHHRGDNFGYTSGQDQKCQTEDLGVTNNVDASSVTGENSASTGTGAGGIASGFAQLVQSALVHMNDIYQSIGY